MILSLSFQPIIQILRIISILIGLECILFATYIQIKSRMKIGFLPIGPFKGLPKQESLINTGIYGVIRHPIYFTFFSNYLS